MRLPFLAFAVLALAVLAAGCTADSAPEAAGGDSAPAAAADEAGLPVVEVASAEALTDDLAGLDAEWVVVNFWATWCGPCRAEMPEFVEFDREMEDQGVHVRFVSLDQPVDLALVKSFLARVGVEDPSYLYTGQGNVASRLNPLVADVLPITMFMDGDGILRHTHPGRLTRADLDQVLATLQAGGDPSTS